MKKFTKFAALLLAAVVCAGTAAVETNSVTYEWHNPFHDVYPQDTYYNAVKFVHKNGLMNGMSDDLFSPDAGMTRAMFVTVLGRLAEMQDFYTDENLVWVTFEDVEADQWYTYYVNWAVTNDIVKGYGNGIFGVND
ncbi:MAG: S-layer homology domain-containing protein, partial [Clostridia bacterium]|nr:S-layer homology domain-containing protein [Clostridia bacterium]